MIYVVLILSGILVGMLLAKSIIDLGLKKNKKIIRDKTIKVFEDVIENIYSGNSTFSHRINDNVYLRVSTKMFGEFDLVYVLSRTSFFLMKNEAVEYISESLDSNIIDSLATVVNFKYYSKIIDVVDFFGFKCSKSQFEKYFNIKYEDLRPILNESVTPEPVIKRVVFDIDEILDKINKSGISSLTSGEIRYLDDYGRGDYK